MAASGSSRRRSPWPDLPAELLGLLLLRLPSHADRVRLPSVCRAWRSAARLQHPLPPLLPWFALPDGTFLSLPDGVVHRLPVPDDAFYGFATGRALFLMHEDGSFSLMSPSSTATVALPEPPFWFPRDKISKVVVSDNLIVFLRKSKVAIYTRDLPAWASTTCMAWTSPATNAIADIAIFQGKLYVLTIQNALHVLDAGGQQITNVCCISKTPITSHDDGHIWNSYHDYYNADRYVRRDYLIVSGDRLLMVNLMTLLPRTYPRRTFDLQRTYQFSVFEASNLSCGRGQWRDVSTLMGRALFISQGCSESVPATAGNKCDTTGVRQDCIYFVTKDDTSSTGLHLVDSFLKSAVIYNMRDQTLKQLPLEASAASVLGTCDGMWPTSWLFPRT
ncbi:hypothetical protein ZWY2020_006794 [Hordeum vulgare]|nr:hypothetical protein ZWY2020_006794 [Hordeum vulgare]